VVVIQLREAIEGEEINFHSDLLLRLMEVLVTLLKRKKLAKKELTED
jgi:hypothetical protein